jgi:hypothetical protein
MLQGFGHFFHSIMQEQCTHALLCAGSMSLVVRPAYNANRVPTHTIIHADTIYHATHLIPIYGNQFLPLDITLHVSYDAFRAYYVNKYADHHAFEITS